MHVDDARCWCPRFRAPHGARIPHARIFFATQRGRKCVAQGLIIVCWLGQVEENEAKKPERARGLVLHESYGVQFAFVSIAPPPPPIKHRGDGWCKGFLIVSARVLNAYPTRGRTGGEIRERLGVRSASSERACL
jgi:hypothetical protein